MLWAERPEAVMGKYPFLGSIVWGNQVLNYSNTEENRRLHFSTVCPRLKALRWSALSESVASALGELWQILKFACGCLLLCLFGIVGLNTPRFLCQTLSESGIEHWIQPDPWQSLDLRDPWGCGIVAWVHEAMGTLVEVSRNPGWCFSNVLKLPIL